MSEDYDYSSSIEGPGVVGSKACGSQLYDSASTCHTFDVLRFRRRELTACLL